MSNWLSFRCGNSKEFLHITNEKLFYKYQEFLPKIEFYEQSSIGSQSFLKFFNNTEFAKVLLFLEQQFNPYQVFAGSLNNFNSLSNKCNKKSVEKQCLANDYGNTAFSTEKILLVIEKYKEALCLSNTIERRAFCYQSIAFFYLQLRGYQ